MKRTRRIQVQKEQELSQKERLAIFNKLKKLVPFQLYIDGIISAIQTELHIDLFLLEKNIPNYNGEQCTYKGKPNYSMEMALTEELGEDVCGMISKLI